MTASNGKPQITLKSIIGSTVAVFAFISGAYALQDLKEGISIVRAFSDVWSSRQFWVEMMFPIAIFMLCFPLVFIGLWRRFVLGKGAMQRVRFITAGASAIYLVSIIYQAVRVYGRTGDTAAVLEKMGLSFVYGGFVLFVLILTLLFPSEEKAKAMETGNFDKLYDERYLQVTRASAHTSLIAVIVLLLTAGSLVDILVYHTLPIRAWIEGLGSLAIWQISFLIWNRRI